MLNALRLRLQRSNYEVITAKDSYNALAVACNQAPDMLILDVHMPAGDGFSVQERLQTMEPLRNLPVIYLTGDKSQSLDKIAEQHGAGTLFYKPFDMEDLLTAIHAALKPKAA